MSRINILILVLMTILCIIGLYKSLSPQNNKAPLVAIANYGQHSSLQETIRGIKAGLYARGYREGKTVEFEIADVSFDASLITQMLSKLRASKPKLIVAISTPVAQVAKNYIKDIPIVFVDVTDPVEAGILKTHTKAEKNITGCTDTQDLSLVIKFAKKLSPEMKRIGILYAIGEHNDVALAKSMKQAAESEGVELLAIPIESAHDIPARMHKFEGHVDMIYVGASGLIQPSLPTIVAIAEEMKIPVLNMNSDDVKDDKVFASYGVTYYKVGIHAGKMISEILDGKKAHDIPPVYPHQEDHEAFISIKRQQQINFELPTILPQSTYTVK